MTPTLVREPAERDGWVAGAVDDFGVVLPSAFPARARVRHPAEHVHGRLPAAELTALIPHLAAATTTPGGCTFAVWRGWGGMLRFGGVPLLRLRHREYQMYRGALDDVHELSSAVYAPGAPMEASPNIAWPDDGAWLLSTEVDLDVTYVAGAEPLADAVAADPLLEGARA